jgi:hypothetical protein
MVVVVAPVPVLSLLVTRTFGVLDVWPMTLGLPLAVERDFGVVPGVVVPMICVIIANPTARTRRHAN